MRNRRAFKEDDGVKRARDFVSNAAISKVFYGIPLAKLIGMRTNPGDERAHGNPHVEKEKSTDDVFEHVIRGVRLNRLRELLRSNRSDAQQPEPGGWVTVEPRTA